MNAIQQYIEAKYYKAKCITSGANGLTSELSDMLTWSSSNNQASLAKWKSCMILNRM